MNVNYRVTEAVTWTLIADIMRRHEATAGLRVIETHPGGGQYDCRTILQPTATDFGPHIHFNLQSGNAACFGTFGPRRAVERPEWACGERDPDRLAYVEAVLQAEHRMQVVNYIEATLGLPSPARSPATTRHALSYRVMAEIAARSMLDGPIVRWVNGREDTSGYEPSNPIRSPLRRVPEIARRLAEPGAERPRTPADAPGYRHWILTARKKPHADPDILAIVDALDGLLFRIDGQGEPLDLLGLYNEVGRDVRRLVDGLVEQVPVAMRR